MNRRNFFKNLGAAIVGVIVAPVVVVKATENIIKPKREGYINVDWGKEHISPDWATKWQWVYAGPDTTIMKTGEETDREFINRLMQ